MTDIAAVYCFIAVVVALNLGALGMLLLTVRHISKTTKRAFWSD